MRLRTISGIFHAQPFMWRETGKVVLVPSFQQFTHSDQYSFQICVCQMDISAFSGQNKVTKMCLKYLLTRYYKCSSQYQILINRHEEIKQNTKFQSLNRVCEYEYSQYSDCVSNIHG